MKWLGVSPSDASQLVYVDTNTNKKYVYPGLLSVISVGKFEDFISKIKNKEIDPVPES